MDRLWPAIDNNVEMPAGAVPVLQRFRAMQEIVDFSGE
jgi:hypothetical protein